MLLGACAGDAAQSSPTSPTLTTHGTTVAPSSTTTTSTTLAVDPADTGLEWEELDTGDVFAGAMVTDAVGGPNGYVAVGYTLDEAAEPRVWHSPDGTAWAQVEGDMGLPVGFRTGLGPAPLAGFSEGAVADRPLVISADGDGYVLAARRLKGTEPPGEECRAKAYLASSDDGLMWSPSGAADLGLQGQVPGCDLPSRGEDHVATDGQLTGLAVADGRVFLIGVARWARAFSTGDSSPAVWVGGREGNLELVTGKVDGLTTIIDIQITADGRPMVFGLSTRNSEYPWVQVSLDDSSFEPVTEGLFIEGRQVGISAVAIDEGWLVAIGTSDAAFGEVGEPELVAWRSSDGLTWARDPIDDANALVSKDVTIGPAGPIAIATTVSVAPDPFVFRFVDGVWMRAAEPPPEALGYVYRLLPTDWGVVAFTFKRESVLVASGAIPRPDG